MTSQFTMWLYPILVLAAVSLVFRLRLPWQWSWCFVVQALPLFACGILGLTVGPDWMYAIFGWALVFLFYFPPKVFYTDLQRYLTALDADNLRRAGRGITLLFWGTAGEFWKDMAYALANFVERKPEEAEALLSKWHGKQGLPAPVAQIPNSYRLIGRGIMWQWEEIIELFEKGKAEGVVSGAILPASARAYAEKGHFAAAAQCLKEAKMFDNMPLNNLSLQVLPYFALIGATMQTKALVAILSHRKRDFPEYAGLYWLGRCYIANKEWVAAQEVLTKAQACPTSKRFQDRIEVQLKLVENQTETPAAQLPEEEKTALINEIWSGFSKSAYTQEIISPRRKSVAVITIIAIIVVVFVLTLPVIHPDLWRIILGIEPREMHAWSTFTSEIAQTVFLNGQLTPAQAVGGQYWRFISYLFLHAHETHLALNIIGLYWFGRVAENIFGTSRFLAIYVVGGLLSGVAHALLSPDQVAVGASGAVMAMFGAVGAGIFRLKDKIPESVRRMELSWLGGLALAQIVLDQVIPHVAAFAHLGGMVSGFAIGMLLSIRTPSLTEVDGTQRFIGG